MNQSPEQVRKRWDALLGVINNVAQEDASPSAQRPPLRAAREMVSESGAAAARQVDTGKRREWNTRHHLLYSTVNDKMQMNIRSYFGRPREIESYGLRPRETLRTIWQLETPEVKPPLGTLRGHYAKFNPGSLEDPRYKAHYENSLPQIANGMSPGSTGMSRATSDPSFHAMRETGWDNRHGVTFSKDNKNYHANMREYFERPRAFFG